MAENKVQKIGFSHLIPDPVVRNVDTHHSESESFRNIHDDQDPQFLKIVEREIYELTIKEAKIEGLQEATDSDNNDDVQEQVEKYEFGGESGGSIFDDEVENEENVRGYFGDLGKQRNGSRKWTRYPMRPAAEDCAFYMKTGSCKFGSSCKFNHPPRRNNPVAKEWTTWREESSGSVALGECKYYITSGGCKYGKDCKYSHGSEKNLTSQSQELNFLGLPIRPGEKECPYYMRTGSCKYGSTCRFHHPDPSTASGGDIPSQHVSSSAGSSSWSFPRDIREASLYVPAPPNQSSTASSPNWNGYQAGTYQNSGGGLPVPPAFSVPAGIKFGAPQHPHNSLVDEYPERPGQPECNYFLKTGDCKFKSSCKFHHPKARMSHPKAGFSTLNDKGLPLRPDQPMCTYYHRYGICKYGPSCKYDHPSSYSPPPPFG